MEEKEASSLSGLKRFFSPLGRREYWGEFNTVYVTAFYCLCALLVTYPLIAHMGEYITGKMTTDLPRAGIFSFWWIKKCLIERHVFPLSCDLINYPTGLSFYASDPLSSIAGMFLEPLFGFPGDYNVIFLVNLVGGALAGYFLVYYFTKNRAGALVGGTLMGFCPARFSTYIDGISDFVHFLWLPLYVLYLSKVYDRKGRVWDEVLSCGIILFMTFFANWYIGLFALLITVFLFVYRLFFVERTGAERVQLFKRSLLVGLVGVGLVFPFAVAQYVTVNWGSSGAGETMLSKSRAKRAALLRRNAADLTEFFTMGKSEEKNRFYPNHHLVYLGYLALLLAGCGLWHARRDRSVIFWAVVAGGFFILALGPTLLVNGEVIPPWALLNKKYLNLFGLFVKVVPGFKSTSHPYRFALIVSIALSVLSGYGVAWLLRKAQDDWRKFLVAAAIAMVGIFEYVMLSPLPAPLPYTKLERPLMYRMMARDKEQYAVLDVPLGLLEMPGSRGHKAYYPTSLFYVYYLTIHGKPIPYSLEGFQMELITGNSFMEHLQTMAETGDFTDEKFFLFGNLNEMMKRQYREVPDALIFQDLTRLRLRNYRYVILHRSLVSPEKASALGDFLGKYLGEPVKFGERWIYML
ncbi:MAG: hypothetical protein RDV48_29805 [Candidatus Eremiobacteraeota bacterium]|nr:hypothetical protein [Candidatus Eremiobacteraeota bacterium]